MGKSENELGWGQEKNHITQPTKQRMVLGFLSSNQPTTIKNRLDSSPPPTA